MSLPERLVRDFHEHFGLPIGDTSRTTNALRARLIREEADELATALELWDADPTAANLRAVAKEFGDLVFTAYGTTLTVGIDADMAVRLVHASNMTKLGPDETGKVVKGPNYVEPDMTAALPAVGAARICVCKHVAHEQGAVCPVLFCGCEEFRAQTGSSQTFAVTLNVESCCDQPRPTQDSGEPDEHVVTCGTCGEDMGQDLLDALRYARLPGEETR